MPEKAPDSRRIILDTDTAGDVVGAKLPLANQKLRF
jgi:hypothetical protein